jgi:hypothetical protein
MNTIIDICDAANSVLENDQCTYSRLAELCDMDRAELISTIERCVRRVKLYGEKEFCLNFHCSAKIQFYSAEDDTTYEGIAELYEKVHMIEIEDEEHELAYLHFVFKNEENTEIKDALFVYFSINTEPFDGHDALYNLIKYNLSEKSAEAWLDEIILTDEEEEKVLDSIAKNHKQLEEFNNLPDFH